MATHCSLALALCLVCLAARGGGFEDLGVPVRKAGYKGVLVGPDRTGEKDLVYFNFMQGSAPLFLVSVDPDTGETRQFNAPKGCDTGGWGFILGPDRRIYVGTFGHGLILRHDPARPEKGIQVVGRPSRTETYIWQFAIGTDRKLYGCTYGHAKLVSFDPKTGQMADLGRMDATEAYTRTIAAGPNGKIYTGIGMAKQNLVAYDPATRQHRSIIPPEWRVSGCINVHQGGDGHAYARIDVPDAKTGQKKRTLFRSEDERLVPAKRVPGKPLKLRDGREIRSVKPTNDGGTFAVFDPKTRKSRTVQFRYEAAGSDIFVVGVGPGGVIYGSSVLPLEVFRYDPAKGATEHLGGMRGGEVYSMLEYRGKLYLCYYGGSVMNLYDPAKPGWNWGTAAGCNPRSFGSVGDGHLRPRAMIYGPDERIYVGSHPPYGQLGGAMAVWDPRQNKTIENYRHIVRDQSIVALAYEPTSGLIFGGSGNYGGGGTRPTQKEALFFAFEPRTKKKVLEMPLVPGAHSYHAICAAEGKVFVAVGSRLVVYDPARKTKVHEAALSGHQVEISLGPHTDGQLYGLTTSAIYRVNPKTYEVKSVAKPPVRIRCGFAITPACIYFGSGRHLWRYRW